MMFPIERHTVFLTLAGSQAHGTAREASDVDVRGVCIAPLPLRLSIFQTFEQYEGVLPETLTDQVLPRLQAHPTAARSLGIKTECVIYDVAKFVSLCAAANPNALEILFANEQDWLFKTPAWLRLHDEREQFLTRKVQQTFLGYAMAQLKRIQTHCSWLLNPPKRQPSREDFGLPAHGGTLSADDQNRAEQAIAEKLRSYGIGDVDMPKASRVALEARLDAFYRDALSATAGDLEERLRAAATKSLGVPSEVASTLNAEKRYRAALKHWDSYQTWQRQRNPSRAELERAYGYDTKHAMHLIRLMRMGLEVLEAGELRVRRDDADELAAIRDGGLSYEALVSMAEALHRDMDAAATTTKLPADVDHNRVDALLAEVLDILR